MYVGDSTELQRKRTNYTGIHAEKAKRKISKGTGRINGSQRKYKWANFIFKVDESRNTYVSIMLKIIKVTSKRVKL